MHIYKHKPSNMKPPKGTVANTIVEGPHDASKCSNTRHEYGIESPNKDQMTIEKSTHLLKCFINHISYLMMSVIDNEDCILHALASSSHAARACKQHHMLKKHDVTTAQILRKFITDTYEMDPEGSFYHSFFFNSYEPCKTYETPQGIINRIRSEGR